jgi:hypothetical protein
MKLGTLKTIASALTDLIVAEETKIREARAQLENALRDALNKPEIGMGEKIPTLPYDDRLDLRCAQNIIEKTLSLTGRDDVKAECERLFELFRECGRKENEADKRISELLAALKDFSSISWRE